MQTNANSTYTTKPHTLILSMKNEQYQISKMEHQFHLFLIFMKICIYALLYVMCLYLVKGSFPLGRILEELKSHILTACLQSRNYGNTLKHGIQRPKDMIVSLGWTGIKADNVTKVFPGLELEKVDCKNIFEEETNCQKRNLHHSCDFFQRLSVHDERNM